MARSLNLNRHVKLYYSPGACSLAAHIVLREIGRPFDLERVDLKSRRTAAGCDFDAINPKGYVPALCLDGGGGELLTETIAVLSWLADLAPERELAPPHVTLGRYHLLEMLTFLATELHQQFAPLIRRTGSAKVERAARGKLHDRLVWLTEYLGERRFLMGPRFTIADAYLFVMLQWCHRYDLDLALFPALEDYEQRVAARPSVQAALQAEGLELQATFRKSA